MSRRRWILVVAAAACAAGSPDAGSAHAAVRSGTVDDPVDAAGGADIASVAVSYDDAGAIALRLTFHAAVPTGADDTGDWSVLTGACEDSRQGLAGLLELASGETTLTYGEVPEEGEPAEHEILARQTLSDDRRELTLVARSAVLAQRDLTCSRIALSGGDEAPELRLTEPQRPTAPVAAPPQQRPAAAPPARVRLRVARTRWTLVRRGRTLTAGLRALVCAPPGGRFVLVIGERRRRVGSPGLSPQRRHRFARRQRLRCQEHRFTWPFRARRGTRYAIRARVVSLRAVRR